MSANRIRQATASVLLTIALFVGGHSNLLLSAACCNEGLDTADNGLKLKIKVVETKFCVGDAEVSTMLVRLRLHYFNSGKRPIILYKGSNLAPSILVSRTVADALAGKRELNFSLSVLPSMEPVINETQRLDDSFVILRKGASFDTDSEVPIPFAQDDQKSPSGAIRKGDHFLQIRVITWPESSSLAERLAAKWKRRGYLWHDVVQSEPTAFRIEQEVRLEQCR